MSRHTFFGISRLSATHFTRCNWSAVANYTCSIIDSEHVSTNRMTLLFMAMWHSKLVNRSHNVINCSASSASAHEFQGYGVSQARKHLMDSGADPNLASEAWVANHWKWITWKIACIIRSKPSLYEELWRPTVVVDQLSYRYVFVLNAR